jgi:hypothetical protein
MVITAVPGLPDRYQAVAEHGEGLRPRPERLLGLPQPPQPGLARARLEDVGESSPGCDLPPPGRVGAVVVLPSAVPQVSEATVNRKLAAVGSFYAHQARNGAGVGDLLAAWQAGGRGGWKPFLRLAPSTLLGNDLDDQAGGGVSGQRPTPIFSPERASRRDI